NTYLLVRQGNDGTKYIDYNTQVILSREIPIVDPSTPGAEYRFFDPIVNKPAYSYTAQYIRAFVVVHPDRQFIATWITDGQSYNGFDRPFADEYSYYFNDASPTILPIKNDVDKEFRIFARTSNSQVNFEDTPLMPVEIDPFLGDEYLRFETRLVGVRYDP